MTILCIKTVRNSITGCSLVSHSPRGADNSDLFQLLVRDDQNKNEACFSNKK